MFTRPKKKDHLKFHRPPAGEGHPLANLKPESRRCLKRLADYTPPKGSLRFPKSRSAAVLVALFIGRMGDLYVLLSRRAPHMRSYAGDTSLPGGKWERGDRSLEHTARREAFEEIGLPMDRSKVPFLCTLEPFLAGNQLIVTPVVVLVLDKTIRPPFPAEPDTLEHNYHTHVDFKWKGFAGKVRMHRFLTGREAGGTKPIFGLTAAILIRAATIGYALAPDYELTAPGQPSHLERIEYALKHHPIFREASVKEGLISPSKLLEYKIQGNGDDPSSRPGRSSPSSSQEPRTEERAKSHAETSRRPEGTELQTSNVQIPREEEAPRIPSGPPTNASFPYPLQRTSTQRRDGGDHNAADGRKPRDDVMRGKVRSRL
ncbi:hypothetical protein EIP91_010298 [Steccherinum ochraceum]|uniref:Nudix hydrolase domain-containing protein n=1 Tax=Steccherinum ochraceum TaxID=92696 RepID=A0A4R0RNJ3_9APHY|nr:hypothetical protein EIP91_010298 [Steccherinum ochraceum]